MSKIKLNTSKKAEKMVAINFLNKVEDKKGIPAYLNEGNLPGHRIYLFEQNYNDNLWMNMTGPIREKDEDNAYILNPRTNEEGQFLDEKGNIVEEEDDAAMQFKYVKDDNDNIVMGTLGTLNLKNDKKDGSALKNSMFTLKLFGDENVLNIERKVAEAKTLDGDERKAKYSEVNQDRKKAGAYHSLFITSGSDELKDLGFNIVGEFKNANEE